MGFWRIVFTIILPPLGVLLGKGFGWAFILNILLTLLGYIPGLIHAFWVQKIGRASCRERVSSPV